MIVHVFDQPQFGNITNILGEHTIESEIFGDLYMKSRGE